MHEQRRPHPKSTEVVRIPNVAAVFTPCHGGRILLAVYKAVPGAVLDLRCPHDNRLWVLELVADIHVEAGLRPKWRDPWTRP